MTSPQRVKDLADVQELIKLLVLREDLALQLNPYVRSRYLELWQASQEPARRFLRLWRNKYPTAGGQFPDERVGGLRAADATLSAMLEDGVTVVTPSGTTGDYVCLVTTDPVIARKYDMHEGAEFRDLESGAGGESK